MALTSGTRLGPYEVGAQIGVGGMGEVYRATDTNLKRQVAIKVLPASVAGDADRLARFQREAEVLAALNHSHIAQIHGLERADGHLALVMELVEGPTLADRIAQGAIPVEEALPIAKQIAEALEAAHEQGIVHRDLKPANIKVRADGTVKVLDFGLAKALEPTGAAATPSATMSPTITTPAMTQAGVILGTAAYMAPEQARGKTVDKRADIWAFGAVLFEMLTGTRAFGGEDIADTLAAVVRAEPEWTLLPAGLSPALVTYLKRCLHKDPKQRIPDIAAMRLALEGAFETAAPQTPGTNPATARGAQLAWMVAGVAVLVAAALALPAVRHLGEAPVEVRQMRFVVSPPDGWRLATASGSGTPRSAAPLAVSPDGSRLAFLAISATGTRRLWVRALDSVAAQELPGTDGALSPFWSPDSRSLAFFADGKLKKIEVGGGAAVTLCDAGPAPLGGSWGRDGVIVFGASAGWALQQVSASGGVPTAATVLGDGERYHARPHFLPDGRHVIHSVLGGPNAGIVVSSLDGPDRTMLLKDPVSTPVLYVRGHLLFPRESTLMAQPFDLDRLTLTGEPVPIAEQLQGFAAQQPNRFFSASDNGVLVYQAEREEAGSRLVWFDRAGQQLGALGEPALYEDVELSPDGTQAAVSLPGQLQRGRDIWLFDVIRGFKTRFTFDPADELDAVWSPDGRRIVFGSRRQGRLDLYQKAADGSGTEDLLFADNRNKLPVSWSADGQSVLYVSAGGPTRSDLFVLPLSGDRTPIPFMNTEFQEAPGRFSPDGRWVAYQSNESGRDEIYIAPFPGPGGRRQVSTAGGHQPRWRRDGTELFFLDPSEQLMAATINGRGASVEVDAVKALFATRATGARTRYAVTADGQRFLINTAEAESAPITVVLNWDAGLTP